MKVLTLWVYVALMLCPIAILQIYLLPVNAQGVNYSGMANFFIFPNSSQRFFQVGRNAFDFEIQHLQYQPQPAFPVLYVNPNILQQQEIQQEEQEHILQQMIQDSKYRCPLGE